VATLGLMLLRFFSLPRYPMVSALDSKLNLRLSQPLAPFEILSMLNEVRDVQQLLVEL
jgi:hypothetical protein